MDAYFIEILAEAGLEERACGRGQRTAAAAQCGDL
jgi:hypothetical protein